MRHLWHILCDFAGPEHFLISDSSRNQLIVLGLLPVLWVVGLAMGLTEVLTQAEAAVLQELTEQPVNRTGDSIDAIHLLLFAIGGALIVASWGPFPRRPALITGLSVLLVAAIGGAYAARAGNPASLIVPLSWLGICLLALSLAPKLKQPPVRKKSRVAELTRANRLPAAFAELRATPMTAQCAADALNLAEAFMAGGFEMEAARVRSYIAANLTDSPTPVSAALPSNSTVPNSLGRYEIEGLLGNGAMGAVYLARDSRINRSVALKVVMLEREFDTSELDTAKARFFQEAESAGRLHHPDIVTIYDAGEQDGRSYIAMECVSGEPLAKYTARQQLLPSDELLEYIARAADALAYAHECHVIHRDIKPANLMIDRANGKLKIMDFGVAQLNDSVRTRTGIILGTPAYMSPEQLRGVPLTGHSDLFSLGVTLYELLTGEAPFKADNVVEIARIVTAGKPVPLTAIRPELPVVLEQVVNKALAKRDNERFNNGWEMASALREIAKSLSRENTVIKDAI